jgi:tRNA(Ile2) C34 agmatinyltransferase TiaS
MSERLPLTLPGERKTCPICERSNVRLTSSGLELVREYRCSDCGARWSVDGRQERLAFLDDPDTWEVMPLPFE